MEDVVQANDHHAWSKLLHFASRYLKLLKSGNRHESLTSALNKQIREDLNDDTIVSGSTFGQKVVKRNPEDPLKFLANWKASKLENGNFKGPVRLTVVRMLQLNTLAATLEALKGKHQHPDTFIGNTPDPNLFSFTISAQEIKKVISSFPNGSAGGPDGLRPQHLKDMTGPSAKEGGQILLKALCSSSHSSCQGGLLPRLFHFFFWCFSHCPEKEGWRD